jgi:hypothetical protein
MAIWGVVDVGVDAPELGDTCNAEPGDGAAETGEIANFAGLSARVDGARTEGLVIFVRPINYRRCVTARHVVVALVGMRCPGDKGDWGTNQDVRHSGGWGRAGQGPIGAAGSKTAVQIRMLLDDDGSTDVVLFLSLL